MTPLLQSVGQQPRKLILAALGGAVVGLAFANLYIATSKVDTSPIAASKAPVTGPGQTGSDKLRTPLDGKSAASFPETTARPIFNANRKPAERQQPQAVAPGGPDDLRLMGILQTASGLKRALIRPGVDAKGVWVLEGEAISGWTLKSIGPRSVVVVNGGRNFELSINRAASR